MPQPWWRSAVFYEVYVRSFADSNDDGIGDLAGVTSRLDYIRDLGVDAIWLTPFYPSPQKDHGYDVADYFRVNPDYGTLRDFDRLVARARELRLKVLVDIVPNHTSDQHRWFKAAIKSPRSAMRRRYHFADPRPDGSPPNNWTSTFGGPAWSPEPNGKQWYLHLFAPEQPDLNWYQPAVQKEFERILKFWLDRGADGFRIDVASALFKRRDLADRPLVTDRITGAPRLDWAFGIIDQPQLKNVYRRWRQIADSYEPPRVLVGEIFGARRQSMYVLPDQLHMAIAIIHQRWDADLWRKSIDESRRALLGPGIEPTWSLTNHDATRPVTRLGGGELGRIRARAALLLLLGLPGQVILYQGEELGLEEADVPESARQDPIFLRSQGRERGRGRLPGPDPVAPRAAKRGFLEISPVASGAAWLGPPRGGCTGRRWWVDSRPIPAHARGAAPDRQAVAAPARVASSTQGHTCLLPASAHGGVQLRGPASTPTRQRQATPGKPPAGRSTLAAPSSELRSLGSGIRPPGYLR